MFEKTDELFGFSNQKVISLTFSKHKHTAPQHRQYLSFDGVGYGSPGQREKQYQQSRASKAYGKVRRNQHCRRFKLIFN